MWDKTVENHIVVIPPEVKEKDYSDAEELIDRERERVKILKRK